MTNLKLGETFATGMVRPKTTALFFDKLWVHPFLIESHASEAAPEIGVPAELCVHAPLGAEEYYTAFLSNFRGSAQFAFPNVAKLDELVERVSSVLGEEDYYTDESGLKHIIFSQNFYQLIRSALGDYVSSAEELIYSFISDFQFTSTELYRGDHDSQPSGNVYLEPSYSAERDAVTPWRQGLPTKYRNKAISNLVKLYAQKGISLTPIYLNPTEYDELLTQETSGLEKNIAYIERLLPKLTDRALVEQHLEALKIRAPRQKTSGLEICLDFIPTVLESELTWKQVFEFRKDKDARKRFTRLRRWFNMDLLNKSQDEIGNILGKRLDDYQWALKKHGIKTIVAGATSVLSSVAGPTAMQMLTSSPLAAVAGGVVLVAGGVAWVANRLIERSDIQRDVVAYIYEVRQLTEAAA